MRIAVYGTKINKSTIPAFLEVISIINEYKWDTVLESKLQEQLILKAKVSSNLTTFKSHIDFKESNIDLIISIGGDGTFIKTINFIRDSNVPVLGINAGRLGFLSNISKNNIREALESFKNGEFVFQKRSLICVQTENNVFEDYAFALNELTIHKKDSASMIRVNASLNDNFLNTYWADGLIVSTPTGSTAYNLSCGGPIVTPGCQVHIITPIAPHNLNVRPLVVPDHMPIELTVEGRNRRFLLSIDGVSKSIKQGEKIIIKKADFMINTIKFEYNNFLDTIRNKMHWGVDKRN